MQKYYDVIVVGCGVVGSGATRCLAENGQKVLAIDQFLPPHNLGSSHGDTRITRLAIGEANFYSPYAIRSHQIWRDLEARTGLELLVPIGGLIMANPLNKSVLHGSNNFLGETELAAKKYRISYDHLSNQDIKDVFPQFNLSGNEEGYYEPTAGFLRPEKCIQAQLKIAQENGARILANTKVASVIPLSNNKVLVQTSVGVFTAGKVIISVGAWVKNLLGDKLDSIFKIHRQVLYWFSVKDNYNKFIPRRFPVFIWNGPNHLIYGFPAIDGPDGGLKIASENTDIVDPDTINRNVSSLEIAEMRMKASMLLPDMSSKCIKAVVCMYTETPDRHFVIDYHPDCSNIIIASPCSGHGFKHSAAIGETLAELALAGKSTLDISPFNLKRFKT